ncbi:MAG: arylsulfatase [Bacteroidaceae bacterium]
MLYSCSLMTPFTLQAQSSAQKPNIIYIMCDDMGYGDLGCYGQQYISTPNLDRMASEGMLFTQAYAGSPVSAPSRASFMTGQHTGHTHVRGNTEYRMGSTQYGPTMESLQTGQEPYDTAHVIIPEIMKDNGYTTGLFGKWAGGYEGSISTPKTRGIDEFYGFICQFQAHAYYPNFLNEYSKTAGDADVHRVVLEENIPHAIYGNGYEKRKQYSGDLIHQKAMNWLDKQTVHQPFLGIFTYTLPHAELYQPVDSILEAYKGFFCDEKKYGGSEGSRYNPTDCAHAQFAAMITRLDTYVGQILAKLKEKNLDKNTMVIFTSDNGPHEEGGADPDFFNRDGLLRGKKRSTYEGGIRVPFIVRWPGKIEAGVKNDHQIAFYDIMPTFCDLIGVDDYLLKYKNSRVKTDYFDGISFAPTLLGKNGQKNHEYLYWEFSETNMLGLRMGNWKMVTNKGICSLYDLANDIHEDKNVVTLYPEITKKMKAVIKDQHINSNRYHVTLPN